MTDNPEEVVVPRPRGFALMSAERRKEVARLGGASVREGKRSFSTNPELAREAGRKGGKKVAAANRSFSRNPDLAREAGRRGGRRSRKTEEQDGSNS